MTRPRRRTKKTASRKPSASPTDTPMSFMDHVRELQSRLFVIAIVFVVAAAATYPFADRIIKIIVAPFGSHELVYLTPGGAFGFVLQVCMYVGFVIALPMIMYHTYKFLQPVMPVLHLKRVIGYTAASSVLALLGVLFAYFISLPAALYFLTGFDLENINAMVTIDSYLSFSMAYLIAGALLFQLPLLLLMVDGISPLTPKKLMGYQRHVILAAFIVAAIISPTPDALNQTLLAGPIVIMYQIGIILVAMKHRKRLAEQKRSGRYTIEQEQASDEGADSEELPEISEPKPHPALSLASYRSAPPAAPRRISDVRRATRRAQPKPKTKKVMDVMAVPKAKPTALPPKPTVVKPAAAAPPPPPVVEPASNQPAIHSFDGMRPQHRVSVPARQHTVRRREPFPSRTRQSMDVMTQPA